VKQDATAGFVARGTIVYVGGGDVEGDGGGHRSTQSAMRCTESLPFSAWSSGWRAVVVLATGEERVNCGGW
jgi:hypothetical protein